MCLEEEYLKATEIQLATLEQCCERKGTSKSDMQRQREIVVKMLQVCQEIDPLHLNPLGRSWGNQFGRTQEMLDQAKQAADGLPGAVDGYILKNARGKRSV